MKTSTLYWILGTWLTFLLVMAITGCRTKSVTEYVTVHDTLRTHHHDTIKTESLNTSGHSDHLTLSERSIYKDVEKIDTEKRIVLNVNGDTIRVEVDRNHYRHTSEKDSTSYYRHVSDSLTSIISAYQSKCDSLQSCIDKRTKKETVVKKVSLLDRLAVCGLLVIGVVMTFSLLKRY